MNSHPSRSGARRPLRDSLNRRILRRTMSALLLLVVVSCIIMAASMQMLANDILLDNLQPMARQAAKNVEANIHMLADRLMTLALDARLQSSSTPVRQNRLAVLEDAEALYELHFIALYDRNGVQMIGGQGAPAQLDSRFFTLLEETDNLTIDPDTRLNGSLGITMGMPVREGGETAFYLVCAYRYDLLSDVLSSINVGKHGYAFLVSRDGTVAGHPSEALAREGVSLRSMDGGGFERVYDRLTSGETGAAETRVSSQATFLAYSPIRGTQWMLVIRMPKSDYAYMTNQAMLTTILAALALLLLSAYMIFRLSRSISGSVRKAAHRMAELSDGDLQNAVPQADSGDELALLTGTLGETVQSLNGYISEIDRVLNHIAQGDLKIAPEGEYKGDFRLIRTSLERIIASMNETMSGFRAAAERLSRTAENLNVQSGELHHASLDQNRSAGELVAEVSLVKAQLMKVSGNTSATRDKSLEISQRIAEANSRMHALSEAMDGIQQNAEQITKIAASIEDISFQTGILSINASVESARAGEAGKGFAVVANEVKRLADRSAEAAQNAASIVEKTQRMIRSGVALTADTASALSSIAEVSSEIGAAAGRLAQAVQEQESALGKMEGRIGDISAIADRNLQNAGMTEQSSSALAQEAEELKAQVRRFALKGDAEP